MAFLRIGEGAIADSVPKELLHVILVVWQRASVELAISTACVEGCRGRPRVLLHALRHYALRAKIILADFNLAVSTLTAKPPNLIPHQIFWLYGIITFEILCWYNSSFLVNGEILVMLLVLFSGKRSRDKTFVDWWK